MDLIKLPEHYCDFQKHANSAQVNGYYKIRFGFHLSGSSGQKVTLVSCGGRF